MTFIDPFDWVDEKEKEIKEERSKGYFDIVEGPQQFVLLTHCAPLAQVFDPATKKYRPAEEGDRGASVKGICWVMQDGLVKQAKLPYVVLKDIRALQQNPDWEFALPFPHMFTLTAIGAGSKEVKYSLTASPKKIEIPAAVLAELKNKVSPEKLVEKIKGGRTALPSHPDAPEKGIDYPKTDIKPSDIPF